MIQITLRECQTLPNNLNNLVNAGISRRIIYESDKLRRIYMNKNFQNRKGSLKFLKDFENF